MADLVEPLVSLMAERVRTSHVVATDDTIMPMQSKGKTTNARMWVDATDDEVTGSGPVARRIRRSPRRRSILSKANAGWWISIRRSSSIGSTTTN